jgi:EmrB/QacA subfamily drug resistance transporter
MAYVRHRSAPGIHSPQIVVGATLLRISQQAILKRSTTDGGNAGPGAPRCGAFLIEFTLAQRLARHAIIRQDLTVETFTAKTFTDEFRPTTLPSMTDDPAPKETKSPVGTAENTGAPSSRPLFLTIFPSIMLPMFLAVADQTIVATALPVIAADFGDVERISWVVVSYLIANTIAAPVYGRLGDSFGRRNMILTALVIFVIGSVCCALAPSIVLLTAARVLQGFGGGGLMTLSQALVGETVPPRERGRYQGYLAAVAVSSNTFGPVAGGYLTQAFGWRSIFLVNVPLGLIAGLLVLRLATQPGDRRRTTFDAPGLLLFIMFVGPVILALEQVQRMQASALPLIGGLIAFGILSLAALVWQEMHSNSPLIPPALFREASVWRSDGLAACHGAALVSLVTFLPIYLRAVRGTSPAETGLLLLPLTFGIGLGSLVAGQLITRTGRTAIWPSLGLSAATAGLSFLAFWVPHLSLSQLPWVFGVTALFMGTVMGVVQVTVQAVAGQRMLGAGAAMVQFSRSVGAAFGTATVAAVLFSVLAAGDRETAGLLGAIIDRGPDAIAALAPARQAVIQTEIGDAFRAAFLTVSCFTGIGALLAWSMPLRRV